MAFDDRTADRSRRTRGIAAALAVHVLFAWLLISGTARKGFELLNKPLQAVVIQDVVVAPPPPPPKLVVPPKTLTVPTQPPPFIPVAEVPVAVPAVLTVEATTVAREAPPPAPAPVVVVAAPPAPAPTPAAKTDMAIVCPTQVPPEMPRRALIDGTQGLVKAQVRIADGVVREITFLSGPRIFYAAVRTAMLQYKCTREAGEVVATQDFNFKLQP
jgi:protein TonB